MASWAIARQEEDLEISKDESLFVLARGIREVVSRLTISLCGKLEAFSHERAKPVLFSSWHFYHPSQTERLVI